MVSSVANQNQTKKIAETGTSQCSYIVMKGAKIFHGHYKRKYKGMLVKKLQR